MIHIIPINDKREHEETTTCKCEPSIIQENGEIIVIHNAFDGREGVEWANEIFKSDTRISKKNKTITI